MVFPIKYFLILLRSLKVELPFIFGFYLILAWHFSNGADWN